MTANDVPQSTPMTAQPFLDVIGVHKRFGGVHALKGVSLAIMPGEIYHLLGENGCGKSTLIKIISGAQPADEGAILVNGRETTLSPLGALSAGIETVYQDLSLLPNLSVAENISLSQQLVERGIRVNAVAPGPIWTPLIPASFDAERTAKHGSSVPMKRAGQPNEVASCFVFLASAEASYMTGQVLHPNGGAVVGS